MSVNTNSGNAGETCALTFGGATWTVLLWFKFNAFTNVNETMFIVSDGNISFGVQLGVTKTDIIAFEFRSAPFTVGSATIASGSDSSWYFVSVTQRGAAATIQTRRADATSLTTTYTTALTGLVPTTLTLFSYLARAIPVINGNMLNFQAYDGVALTDRQILNQSYNMQPKQTPTVRLPLVVAAQANIDWSGNGNNFTVTGTFTNSRSMPPIGWK